MAKAEENKKPEEYITEKEPYVFARPWHSEFPPMIVVSITNVCNLECTHCFHKEFKKRDDYHATNLEFGIWEKVCKETAEWPGVVMNFGTDGEPLCHPRFLDMLRLAREYKITPINITTNGVLMNGAFNEAIVKENLTDVMNISLDAVNPETFKKIRGGDLSKVVSNVNDLIERRNRAESPMKIQVNIIDQPDAAAEVEEFRRVWGDKVDNVMVRTYYDATAVTGQTGKNITGKQKEFDEIERWPCQQLWRRFNIGDDGTARFCVDDWFNKTRIGDLREESIAGIWTGEAYNRLRHIHISGEYREIPYCAKCTEWQGMRWDYDYFTALEKMLGKKLV